MPSLAEMTTEAESETSSPEGQQIQSEILSLQQETRLKKQQLAEIAASVQQVRSSCWNIKWTVSGLMWIQPLGHVAT